MNKMLVPPFDPGLFLAIQVDGAFFTRPAPSRAACKKAVQAGSPQVFWDPHATIYPNKGLFYAFAAILRMVPPEGIRLYSNARPSQRFGPCFFIRADKDVVDGIFESILEKEARLIRGMRDQLKDLKLQQALVVRQGGVFQNTPVCIHIPGNEPVLSLPVGRSAEIASFNARTELPVFPAGQGSADANYYLAPVRAALPDYMARLDAWNRHNTQKCVPQPA